MLKIIACSILISLSLFGAKDEQPIPVTKIEALSIKKGIVLVKGYTNIGSVNGSHGGEVSVTSLEIKDASNPKTQNLGLVIDVNEGGRVGKENRSYIDIEEIESLLAGIDYITKITSSDTKLEEFEASYQTKSDLRITVFSSKNGDISAAISSGYIHKAQVFMSMIGLNEIRNKIVLAQETLKAPKVFKENKTKINIPTRILDENECKKLGKGWYWNGEVNNWGCDK